MLIWMTSALYVYEFFEMFHAVCLFPTVPQFETLEYILIFLLWSLKTFETCVMDFNIQRYKNVFLDINETNEKISNLSLQLKKRYITS